MYPTFVSQQTFAQNRKQKNGEKTQKQTSVEFAVQFEERNFIDSQSYNSVHRMENTEKKTATDRFYPGYKNNSYKYPPQPQLAPSFLRHSQQGSGRQSWNDDLQRKATRPETAMDKMKKLDLAYEKNQKAEQAGGKGKYEFLRHTIDYHGKGYQPEEYGGIGKNRDHYQSSNALRKYTGEEEEISEGGRHYGNPNAKLSDYQPKEIDFLARSQHYKNKTAKTYTDIGNSGETNEEELNYNLPRNAKSPRHRVRTEGQDYGYQNQNHTYSGSRASSDYQHHSSNGTPYADEVKITRTNTYNFEKKYDNGKFMKKPYQYQTPKSYVREEINSPNTNTKKSATRTATGMESPHKSSANSKPTSVSSSVKPSEAFISKYDGYSPTTNRFSGSKVEDEVVEKRSATTLNLTKENISLSRQKEHRHFCLKDFELGKCLGEGKFGNVYMAIHKDTKSIFALKKVKKDQIKEHKLQNQFMMEIKMQLYFNHKNILTLYGFFDDESYVYLVLEYMEQGTLFSHMKKEKKLTEIDASHKIKEVLESVNYLHEMNIAHRDIKPENIVISNSVCKLCDFGWSAICDQRRKTLCGTIDYVTPQVLKGEEYGIEVDLWCLGVLCYELLVGKAPFYHIKIKETMKKIMNADTADIKLPNDMSADAKDFISKLIVNDPDNRMSAGDALEHPFITKHKEEEILSPTRK